MPPAVPASLTAVMLCSLLQLALDRWAARGRQPAEAQDLANALAAPPDDAATANRAAAFDGATSALGDAEDAVARARDHVEFIART